MKLSTVFLLAAELLESLPEERVFCCHAAYEVTCGPNWREVKYSKQGSGYLLGKAAEDLITEWGCHPDYHFAALFKTNNAVLWTGSFEGGDRVFFCLFLWAMLDSEGL